MRVFEKIKERLEKETLGKPTPHEFDRGINRAIRIVSEIEAEFDNKLVSIEVYKQVARERDVAEEQLHELGYQLGEKIDYRIPWISVKEQEEPEENGNYLVTACFYDDPDKTKTEIVSFCGEWNIGNNWNIVAWCPQRIEEYKPKGKAKDAFLSR